MSNYKVMRTGFANIRKNIEYFRSREEEQELYTGKYAKSFEHLVANTVEAVKGYIKELTTENSLSSMKSSLDNCCNQIAEKNSCTIYALVKEGDEMKLQQFIEKCKIDALSMYFSDKVALAEKAEQQAANAGQNEAGAELKAS